jgi:hypothetical protein
MLVGSFLNAKATASYIRAKEPEHVSLVCMGNAGISHSEEDYLCALYLKSLIEERPFEDLEGRLLSLKESDGKKFFDENTSGLVMAGLLLVTLIPTFIAMKKYNGFGRDNSGQAASIITRPTKWVWVSMGLTVSFVIILFVLCDRAPKIEVNEETISISGMYGRDIPVVDIVSVELLENLPSIRQRTNGSSTFKYNKGHFLLKNGERCIMIVLLDAPYIEIRTVDNLYYLNGANRDETELLFQQIKQLKP